MADGPGAGRDEEAVRRFIERFALDLSEAGMARMPARAFAAILAPTPAALTAAELAELLQASPAAVSGAVATCSRCAWSAASASRGSGATTTHLR